MIVEYHRPKSIEAALELLARPQPYTVPLGGGSALNKPSAQELAVVDLQALNLNQLQARGNQIDLGATMTLQMLQAGPSIPGLLTVGWLPALQAAVQHEASYNLRQVATVAGTLIVAGGRSPLATAFLALDAVLNLQPGDESIYLGDLLPFRAERLRGRLVTYVTIPAQVRLAYEYVARTPADQPIVCAAVATWPSGRTRLALGGYGAAPVLAFDGGEAGGIDMAAQSAYAGAADQWASAVYRSEVAVTLAQRCLQQVTVLPK